jgi:hypothetical protein
MEEWIPLRDYPGYSASHLGRIRNDTRERVLAIVKTQSRHTYVGLMQNGEQVKRSVANLVASAFVSNPRPHQFTTPIHRDGDVANSEADNLLWRPRWFAIKFTQQFRKDLDAPSPVRDRETGEVFEDLWIPVMRYGLLYMDILLSIPNRTVLFPTLQAFEWAE